MKRIYLITLAGQVEKKHFSPRTWRLLTRVQPLYLWSSLKGLARELEKEGVEVTYFEERKEDNTGLDYQLVVEEAIRRDEAAFVLAGSFKEEMNKIKGIMETASSKGNLEVVIVPEGGSPKDNLEEGEQVRAGKALSSLIEAMARLRSPQGCPWDQRQDHKSLKPYLIEEAYEVVHAIDLEDKEALCEELGDLLLQIVFHSQLAAEQKVFTMEQVIERICEKIIRRHPHVFGKEKVEDADEVSFNWSEIKLKEKDKKSRFSMPAGLPALKRAQKVQQQAARYGFDWDHVEGAWEKVKEELKELEKVYNKRERDKIEEEIGDLIFAIVNISRFLRIDAELALAATVEKFLRRMHYIEEVVEKEGKNFKDYHLEDLDKIWEDAKKKGL